MELKLEFDFNDIEQTKIKELRQMVLDSSELAIGTEDIFLTKFLYCTEWNVPQAFEKIRKFYDFKHDYPQWSAQHPVEYFREQFLDLQSKFVMPRPDREGRLICVAKPVDGFDRYPNYFYDSIEIDDLISEALLLLPNVQKYGITLIIDTNGASRATLKLMTPSISRLVSMKTDILPFTNRIVHVIQRGVIINAATSLVMPFMSKKIRESVFIHDGKNFDKLRKMVGYDRLPADYGGPSTNTLDVNILYNFLMLNSDYLLKLQSYRKRVEPSKKKD